VTSAVSASTGLSQQVQKAAELVARQSYGRLLAWLAWQWRDIAAAEDALAEAFSTALVQWPVRGVPDSPDAWLLTAAKRQLLMVARRQRLASDPRVTAVLTEDELAPATAVVPDVRLRLLLVCAHPAIDCHIHTPLMLQTVLGLDAARIASAFLVKPEAMTKRLGRAKAKIKVAGIRFEEPDAADLAERIDAVLEGIYAGYTLHWGQANVGEAGELAQEALFLAELVAGFLPECAEALGLAALIALGEATRPARLDPFGAFVPLHAQAPQRWDGILLRRAEDYLLRAAQRKVLGRYQLEAAIQSAHIHGVFSGCMPWQGIVVLHEQLLAVAPSMGGRVAYAVARGELECHAQTGLDILAQLDPQRVSDYQPWWVAQAYLLAMQGAHDKAMHAYGRALALTAEPALREWLENLRSAQERLSLVDNPSRETE
jgi:RNA polymerase sigma-70 factor (ECF subfamily)